MELFHTFVVHYTPLIERRSYLEGKFQGQALSHEFITNCDREDLSSEQLKKFNRKQISLVGCAISCGHIEAYKRIVNSPYSYNLIFEDDVIFKSSFKQKMESFLQELPIDYDMLFIGNGGGFHIPFLKRVLHPLTHVFFKENKETKWGGAGATRCADSYFVSKKCAKKILDYIEGLKFNSIDQPVDWWLNEVIRRLDLKVYWLEPTLVTQGTMHGLYKSSNI